MHSQLLFLLSPARDQEMAFLADTLADILQTCPNQRSRCSRLTSSRFHRHARCHISPTIISFLAMRKAFWVISDRYINRTARRGKVFTLNFPPISGFIAQTGTVPMAYETRLSFSRRQTTHEQDIQTRCFVPVSDLDPMTLIYELDLDILKVYMHSKTF